MEIIKHPKTGKPLSNTAQSIIRVMGGAFPFGKVGVEKRWPIFDYRFGPESRVRRALDCLEAAGLIERTDASPLGNRWAYDRAYSLTDKGRAHLAPEVARLTAREASLAAERQAAQEAQERAEAERTAENERVARIVAAYPDMLHVLQRVESLLTLLDADPDCDCANTVRSVLLETRAAITKAEGGE